MTNLCKSLIEGFIKKTYEDELPQEGTGLIVYAYGDRNKPTLAWGRASSTPRAYGMRNYRDLAKVRANNGDVSNIVDRKERNSANGNGGGYDDGIIDLIREQQGNIWVHSFIPTSNKADAIDMKEWMYERGVFSAKIMRYVDPNRPEAQLLNIV